MADAGRAGIDGMTDVTLIVFPGGFNWPVWVAHDQRLFDRRGVRVSLETTPGSVFQWTALARGDAQLAITLMDNVVAYCEGQGAPGIVVPDAVALMALDTRSMPALVTPPTIRSYAELKGGRLAVDALMTGNALVLRRMLEHGGLAPQDYRLEEAGGVTQRFEAMKRYAYAGSLFNAPLDAALRHQGYNVLDTAHSVLDRFQGHVVAASRAWAQTNRAAVVAFLHAMADAVTWLYDPRHRIAAFELYRRHMPGAPAGAAEVAYSVLFHPSTGFPLQGELDPAAIDAVLDLRARYGEPSRPLRAASAYSAPEFLAEALSQP
jgi:ABC-type nitrate/sulfonate/bicarbonate transport system substrate-binding protein